LEMNIKATIRRYMTNPILSECSLYIIAVPASRRSLTVKSNLNLEGRTVKYSHHMRPAKRAYSRKFSCISESGFNSTKQIPPTRGVPVW
ncbi:hypothetical protein T09_12013, partial [Trichinella sp. T9]